MSSLDLYRSLVPEHAAVADPTVTAMLALAARRHTAAAFGVVYPEAMVYWAAHRIQRSPGLVSGGGGASDVGVITSQRDGDLSRSYAVPAGATAASADAELHLTRYGQWYLDLRSSRSATSPTVVGPGSCVLPGTVLR